MPNDLDAIGEGYSDENGTEGSGGVRILVVDDHPVVRFGVVELLRSQADFDVVGEAETCAAACERIIALKPDVVLLDLELGDACGADALSKVRKISPRVPIIVFTAYDNDWRVVESIKIGIQGYLVKGTSKDKVLEAVRVAYRGGTFIDPSIASKVLGQVGRKDERRQRNGRTLTKRELRVLRQLAQGKRNKEISKSLFISERTVKFHMSALLRKFGASNRTEVVKIAVDQGLLSM